MSESKARSRRRLEFRPQPGPQEQYIACDASVVIFGGSAGGGKTYGTLLDALRFKDDPTFGAVIFRRNGTDIFKEGGIWDQSEEIYPMFGAVGRRHAKQWMFPSGSKVTFAHLEHLKDRFTYQGTRIRYIGFEELTHFHEKQFWYLFSRNTSIDGGQCYIRATCNPDPDSFVRKLIDWYIDQKTGYAVKERSGVVRWFIRDGDRLVWGATERELKSAYPKSKPVSFTFIRSDIYDNPALLAKDPDYLSKLEALSTVEREQLLKGNWNVRPAAGLMFKRDWFPVVEAAPRDALRTVRYWDLAATEKREDNDPDWTVGVKMSLLRDGGYVVPDVRRERFNPTGVEDLIVSTSRQDGTGVEVFIEQEPGASGEIASDYLKGALAGFPVHVVRVGTKKELRALGLSSQAGRKRVAIVRAAWNEDYLTELENFPDGKNDDQVDGSSGAFSQLAHGRSGLAAVPPAESQRRHGRVEFTRGRIAV